MNIQGGDISAELMDVVHAIAMRTIATETLEETAKPEYMSEVEFAIVDRLLSDALSAGYLISDCDVISDYIDNRAMELLTAGALALADEYAGRQ